MRPTSAEQAVFAEVLQRDTPGARAAYLDGACGTDTALRRRVEALLCAAENAGDFLEQPPTALGRDSDSCSLVGEYSENPGHRIGRYKLLEKIDEGGCGVVYMAEQEEPVRRRVALKVIKLGMDTKSVIARFPTEPLLAYSSASGFPPTNLVMRVRLWNLNTRRQVAELPLDFLCSGLAFSPDGALLVTSTLNFLTLWDVRRARHQPLITFRAEGSSFFPAFDSSGNVLAARNVEGKLSVWRAPLWKEIEAAETAAAPKL